MCRLHVDRERHVLLRLDGRGDKSSAHANHRGTWCGPSPPFDDGCGSRSGPPSARPGRKVKNRAVSERCLHRVGLSAADSSGHRCMVSERRRQARRRLMFLSLCNLFLSVRLPLFAGTEGRLSSLALAGAHSHRLCCRNDVVRHRRIDVSAL
jgi:hypothetical protein